MQEKRALGKGLSSLIPMGGRSDRDVTSIFNCPIEDIVPNQSQPRKLFEKTSLDELAASIEEKGILQPLLARRLGGGKYEIIAGERRYRAAKQLHLETVPVIVKDVAQEETLELALIENLQREDLNAIEEAISYQDLITKYQYTQDELARRIGRDRSSIANTLRLLKLPDEIRGYLIAGKLTRGHARALLAVDNKEAQKRIAEEIMRNDLSVRDIEDWTQEIKQEPINISEKVSTHITNTQQSEENPFKDLEEQLKKTLKIKVIIKSRGKKGKLILHFSSPDELDGLYQRLVGEE